MQNYSNIPPPLRKRWVPDLAALGVMEFCKSLSDELLLYAATIDDENQRSKYMADCLKWQRRIYRETILKEAQSIYPNQWYEP